MSAQPLLARRAQRGPPALVTSSPRSPDSGVPPPEEQECYRNSLPLPDHFPEPYVDCGEEQPSCSSAGDSQAYSPTRQNTPGYTPGVADHQVYSPTRQKAPGYGSPGAGHRQVYSPSRQSTPGGSPGVDAHEEAKAGVRRITDKYATPVPLAMVNGVSPLRNYNPTASPKGSVTLSPAHSPSPASPISPTFSYEHSSPAMPGKSGSSHRTVSAKQNGGISTTTSVPRLAPLSVSAFSDVSSDLSDGSPSPAYTDSTRSGSVTCTGRSGVVTGGGGRYQSVGGISLSSSLGDGVKEEDVQQVEMFFRSHKTQVTVCRSLANLYFGSVQSGTSTSPTTTTTTSPNFPGTGGGGSNGPVPAGGLWEFVTTGIPLLVLDSGDHHRQRQLTVVVAEKGTGFVLWKDVVSHLTGYTCPHANFHTLRLSSDSGKLAGLSFDDSKAAAEFASAMASLTSDPDDELLMLSKKGKKKKKKQEGKRKTKFKPPKKSDISQPCCFQHVTKLERPQVTGLMPLPPNGFPLAPGGSVSSLTDVLQDRLSLSRAHSNSSGLSDSTGH